MCEEAKILKSNALKAYNKADKAAKEVLSELLKGQVDFNQKITDRINGYLDACTDQGIKPLTIDDFNFLPAQYRERAFKNYQQMVIAGSLNEGWILNWADYSQRKYYPWFEHKGAGFGFSCTSYVHWGTDSGVGSRLYFKDDATAAHFGKICIKESLL